MRSTADRTTARRHRRRCLVACVAAACIASALLTAAPAAAQDRAHVYRVQHRAAEELLPLAETVMAGQGSAVVDAATNSIVLVGPSGAVAETMTLLAKQDRRARTIVIHHEERTTRELAAEGVQVDWSVGSDALRIGNVRFPDGGSGVEIEAHGERATARRELSSTMRVVEGQRTRITTGSSVPMTVGRRGERSTEWIGAESGMEASARVLGDGRVEVDLAAFSGRFRRSGAIARGEARTRVAVRPGETVAIGGLGDERASEQRELASGIERERAQEERLLLLRVEIE